MQLIYDVEELILLKVFSKQQITLDENTILYSMLTRMVKNRIGVDAAVIQSYGQKK